MNNPPAIGPCPRCGTPGRVEHRDDRTLYWHAGELFPCSVHHDELERIR